jgi:hypothetical protein
VVRQSFPTQFPSQTPSQAQPPPQSRALKRFLRRTQHQPAHNKQAYTVPVPTPPTEREKRIVAFQKDITAKRRDGPFYTKPMTNSDPTHPFKVFDEDQENQRYKQDKQTDPFTGVPTWSEKYKPKARELPEFSSFPFCEFSFLFPTLGWIEIGWQLGWDRTKY